MRRREILHRICCMKNCRATTYSRSYSMRTRASVAGNLQKFEPALLSERREASKRGAKTCFRPKIYRMFCVESVELMRMEAYIPFVAPSLRTCLNTRCRQLHHPSSAHDKTRSCWRIDHCNHWSVCKYFYILRTIDPRYNHHTGGIVDASTIQAATARMCVRIARYRISHDCCWCAKSQL